MLSPDHDRYLPLHRVIVSQAITGEMVGIEHYARMIALAQGVEERLSILEDAWHERHHVRALQDVAKRLGIAFTTTPDDAYWGRVRSAFDERAAARDLLGCTVIQDIVLESYAVVLYAAIQPGVEPFIADRLATIADDERKHLARGQAALQTAYADKPLLATSAVEFANERVARVLCEWVQPSDCVPICGVCGVMGGSCAKQDLALIDVNMAKLQADFTSLYGRVLREVGFPTAAVTRWIARLSP
jgi:fatty aldehyde decarbonylase